MSTGAGADRGAIQAFGPGRVNLIGEHTDYNDGLALPFALDHGVSVTAAPLLRGDGIRAHALDLDETDSFPIGDRSQTEGWRAFVRGAVAELGDLGITVPDTELWITGDLPHGSGLSSSAALETALCLALLASSGLDEADWPSKLELAKLCQRIENDWVGANTGLLDQLASLFGAPEQAVLIDFRSLQIEPMPLVLGDHRLVTLDSGQSHDHSESGYNDRRRECLEAAHRMGKESLRDAMIQDLHLLPDVLERRARHVIGENGRVQLAVAALRTGDFEALGHLLDASHASLRDLFEVSTPALEEAVSKLKCAGALGARLLGGGFGGNVLGLMPAAAELPAGAHEVRPGPGARLLPKTDQTPAE